jgi:hypothetical protein
MSKGDRAHLERLLRSAWERQVILRVSNLSMPSNKNKSPFNKGDSIGLVAIVLSLFLWFVIPNWYLRSTVLVGTVFCCFVFFRKSHWTYLWSRRQQFVWAIMVTIALGCVGVPQLATQWRDEHAKSVLTFGALATNVAYPKGKNIAGLEWQDVYAQLDLTIENPEPKAIQNVDLHIHVTPGVIFDVGQFSDIKGVEFHRGSEAPDIKMRFRAKNEKGEDTDSTMTMDSRDMLSLNGVKLPSSEWKVFCPRISGETPLRLMLATSASQVAGAADPTSIHVFGTYELVASENSKAIKVDKTITVQR